MKKFLYIYNTFIVHCNIEFERFLLNVWEPWQRFWKFSSLILIVEYHAGHGIRSYGLLSTVFR